MADVALLMRRVRERLEAAQLQCIGTSGTMAREGSIGARDRLVARVAHRLFPILIDACTVVV